MKHSWPRYITPSWVYNQWSSSLTKEICEHPCSYFHYLNSSEMEAVLMSNNKLIEKENVQLHNSTQILNETMLFIKKWMELGILLIKENNIFRKTNTICFLLYFAHKI